MLFIFILKDALWLLILPDSCIRLIICKNGNFTADDFA